MEVDESGRHDLYIVEKAGKFYLGDAFHIHCERVGYVDGVAAQGPCELETGGGGEVSVSLVAGHFNDGKSGCILGRDRIPEGRQYRRRH